jgi:membrane protein DedA with SNARE-associated domain
MIYFIIYVATTIFGNIAAFLSFWIIFEAHLGILDFLGVILVVFLADMSGDLLWYSLGSTLRGTAFGFWTETHIPGHARAEAMLQRKGARWIVFSKFIMGFAPPVVFSIGWSGINLKTFFKNSFISSLLWVPVLSTIVYGILVGITPFIKTGFKQMELTILVGFLIFIAVDYLLIHLLKIMISRFNGDECEEKEV